MKNYSLNKKEAEIFILNYIILNNFIIVNYANGNVITMPYSTQKEKNILEKMRHQVLDCGEFYSILKNKFKIVSKLLVYEVIIFVSLLAAIVITPNPALVFVIVSIFSLVIGISFTLYKVLYYQKLRNDIKKHLLFLDNEDYLNLILRNNKNIRQNLDTTSLTKVYEGRQGDFSFDINTIDNINYSELKHLYEQTKQIINNNDIKVLKRKK